MALMNFLKEGTYVYVEHFAYSKQKRTAHFVVTVKDKDEVIFSSPMNVTANSQAVVIDKTITLTDELLDLAPEYLNMKVGENYLIKIDNPTTDYIIDINNKIVSKNEYRVLITVPTYYYDPKSQETYKYDESTGYVKLPRYSIQTTQQFDNWFDSTNVLKSIYEYLKMQPAFANCIDA